VHWRENEEREGLEEENSLFIVNFLWKMKGAIFVSKTNRSSEENRHRLVG